MQYSQALWSPRIGSLPRGYAGFACPFCEPFTRQCWVWLNPNGCPHNVASSSLQYIFDKCQLPPAI